MSGDKLSGELVLHGLEVVIGLETHVRLNTLSKLFCSCSTAEAPEPNINICPVCTGQMGVLPSVNGAAVRKAVLLGRALDSDINEVIAWDRKHYEYPDLPKNYQLSQFHYPIIKGGVVDCYREDGSRFSVEIEQAHIEEDAAKLVHEKHHSLVDFNKSGVALIEIVTKPCISNIKNAAVYAQYLHRIVQNLKISDANLEKGEFKSDVSVSLRKTGSSDLNPRTEIKNLNSFRYMVEALEEEVSKQMDFYVKNGSFRPDQTTVLWDAELKQTRTMRKKEFAADYRFLPEPDIPFVNIKSAIDECVVDVSLLPFVIETRLIEGGVRPQDARFFTSDTLRSKLFLGICEKVNDVLFVARTLSNNIKQEDYEKIQESAPFASLFLSLYKGEISFDLFRHTIKYLLDNPDFDYVAYIDKHSFSVEKIDAAINESLDEARQAGEVVKTANAGAMIAKVMSKLGKLAPGKVVKERISFIIASDGASAVSESAKGAQTDLTAGDQTLQKAANQASAQHNTDDSHFRGDTVIKEVYRTHRVCDLSNDSLGLKVTLAGWVASLRDHGDLVFIDLRDTSNEVFQVRLQKSTYPDIDIAARLKPESVIMVEGDIIARREDDINSNIRTGSIELDTSSLDVLNYAKSLPFEVKRATHTNENTRFKYKFLDHRNSDVHKAIVNRHKVIKLIRDILDRENFLEIETPVLTGGTDEGAREFIVPSRKFPGKFYTLPQAPQQFKQMLMVGGFERYFQIARCFRDEDSRGDRQPEFTQLDMELSFASMKQIIELNTRLFIDIVNTVYKGKWKLMPFRTLTYYESMEKYGCDRPDLRYGLEMQDITEVVKATSFQVFSKPVEQGGIVKCIKVSGDLSKKRLSKGQIETLTGIARELGLGGLAYIVVNENELQSPIIKYLGENIAQNIISASQAVAGDIVFFAAAEYKVANKALDAVRQEIARMLHLIKPNELHPAWVIDFPLFEQTEEGGWTFSHNPFSMPKIEHIPQHVAGEKIGEIISQQYDFVVNGNEVGGGSIRAHKSEILEATYRNMGYNHEEMMRSVGHMWEAFKYGAPPHGGIAWGIDRLMMILEKRTSIREVMAFPKTGSGEDLLFSCPSPLSQKKVSEANISLLMPGR
jgi:aspartyl-tRNA synthetase